MNQSKMVYGNRLEDVWLATAMRVRTQHNKEVVKHYRKSGVIPVWIQDCEKKMIRFKDHGKITKYGWEADHVLARAKGGSNDLSNMQALNWIDNRIKSDSIDYMNKKIHRFFKSLNCVNYRGNFKSLRKVEVGGVYLVLANSRVTQSYIGRVVSKTSKYVEVSFNNDKPMKVYPDPELFGRLGRRSRVATSNPSI